MYEISVFTKPHWKEDGQELLTAMDEVGQDLRFLEEEHKAAGTNPEDDTRYLMSVRRAHVLMREADDLKKKLLG